MKKRRKGGLMKEINIKAFFAALIIGEASVAMGFMFSCRCRPEISAIIVFLLAVYVASMITDGYVYSLLVLLLSYFQLNHFLIRPYIKGVDYYMTIIVMFMAASVMIIISHKLRERERYKVLVKHEKMKNDLLSSISYGIRTPLTAIMGSTSIFLEGNENIESSTSKKLLENIYEESQWLLRLAENFLFISSVGNKQEGVIKTSLEMVEEVVAEGAAKVKKRFPDMAIQVTVPKEPIMIRVNAILIEQVIINLLEYAICHSDCDERTKLTVSREGEDVLFELNVYGLDLDENHKNEDTDVFEKSGRIKVLYFCRTIIEAHGGSCGFVNEENGEFKYWFVLEGENADINNDNIH